MSNVSSAGRDVQGSADLGFLGVAVDESRNAADGAAGDDREITARGARVRTFVVAAREDKQISAEVRSVLRYSD